MLNKEHIKSGKTIILNSDADLLKTLKALQQRLCFDNGILYIVGMNVTEVMFTIL